MIIFYDDALRAVDNSIDGLDSKIYIEAGAALYKQRNEETLKWRHTRYSEIWQLSL